MKRVGVALENLALSDSGVAATNLLGRSAFNRYYYASFLVTREMLAKLDPKWKTTPHSELPKRLRETIRKPVKKELDRQARSELISLGEKSRLLSNLQLSSENLAELLERAYDARVIADYTPEEPVVIAGKVISLRSHKLTTAREWPDRAHAYCKTILRVWEDVGLA
ncbi:MAG: hypothetical protein V7749_12095 [Cocleimonas sp.]|jgi:hypothetical protein